jgi:hypothetical protein
MAELTNSEKSVLVFAAVLGGFTIVLIEIILNAWVLMQMWGWFWVTTFGLPVLSIPAAIGISMTVKFVTGNYTKVNSDDSKKNVITKIAISLALPICILGIGYIVHLFI